MRIDEVKKSMQLLNTQVKELLHESKYDEYDEFCPDEYKTNRKSITDEDGYTDNVADLTPDEWQLVHEYDSILEKLDSISDRLSYLSKPITHNSDKYSGYYFYESKQSLSEGIYIRIRW